MNYSIIEDNRPEIKCAHRTAPVYTQGHKVWQMESNNDRYNRPRKMSNKNFYKKLWGMNPTIQAITGKLERIIRLVLLDFLGRTENYCQFKYLNIIVTPSPLVLTGLLSLKWYVFILQYQNYKTLVNDSLYLYITRSKSERVASIEMAVKMRNERSQTYLDKREILWAL